MIISSFVEQLVNNPNPNNDIIETLEHYVPICLLVMCELFCQFNFSRVGAAFGILDEKRAQIKLPAPQAHKLGYAYN